MTDFTPGPWEATKDRDGGYAIMVGNSPRIAYVHGLREPTAANAHLIAAAPDLLAAAEALMVAIEKQLSMTGKGITPSPRVAAALAETRAAIAKARP